MSTRALSVSSESDSPLPTRDRLIAAMLNALRRKGYHGVGLSELLTEAGAPKGVLYHHFPQGKTELAVAAIEHAVDGLARALDKLLGADQDLASSLKAYLRTHYIQPNVGHYGVFSGRRWQQQIYPRVREMIHDCH